MLKLNLNNNISKRLFYENILIRREHNNVNEKKKQKKLRQISKIGFADDRITISRRFDNVSPAVMPNKPKKKCAARSEFSRFRRRWGCTELVSGVTRQKKFLTSVSYATISLEKNRRFAV